MDQNQGPIYTRSKIFVCIFVDGTVNVGGLKLGLNIRLSSKRDGGMSNLSWPDFDCERRYLSESGG